jgi:hypothetical protein
MKSRLIQEMNLTIRGLRESKTVREYDSLKVKLSSLMNEYNQIIKKEH